MYHKHCAIQPGKKLHKSAENGAQLTAHSIQMDSRYVSKTFTGSRSLTIYMKSFEVCIYLSYVMVLEECKFTVDCTVLQKMSRNANSSTIYGF